MGNSTFWVSGNEICGSCTQRSGYDDIAQYIIANYQWVRSNTIAFHFMDISPKAYIHILIFPDKILNPSSTHSLLPRLQDRDDDVRCVAAETLLPVTRFISPALLFYVQDKIEINRLVEILTVLWNTLLELDDLSASTASVMDLLGM